MTTLYKKDSKEKIRVWKAYSDGPSIVQVSGLLDGKLVENRKDAKAKNIGRANETTPETQAKSEVESLILQKLDEGYFLTVSEAYSSSVMLPMLAKDYKKESHKINWKGGVYVQQKFDGMRCLAIIEKDGSVKLMSRKGKEIDTVPHIIKDLSNNISKVHQDYAPLVLDGELYAHGESFQEQMRLIKKTGPDTEKIKFNVYDILANGAPLSFRSRHNMLNEGFSDKAFSHVVLAKTVIVYSENEMKDWHKEFLSEGFEGTMIRHGNSPYEVDKRSSSLLKYKDFIDLAIPIKDIIPSDARPDQGFPVFHWPGAKDDELKAGVKMSHTERIDMLTNKDQYIGKIAELRFFEYSENGVPRFPVMVGIRLDK